jgi:DNA-directed RNA polymerase beta' subunit
MKLEKFLTDTLYQYAKEQLLKGFYIWLDKQDIEDLKEIVEENKQIVQQVNNQYSSEDIEQIPRYLREIIVEYLPQIKNNLIEDTIKDLANHRRYYILVKKNKPYLYELLERCLNILYIRTRNTLN